jgi:hypothetical protein
MTATKHCELFGTLEKIEKLSTVSENVVRGSLVLESLSPFCGYYNDDPQDCAPLYVYIAVDKNYSVFDIVRAAEKVLVETGFDLDIAKAFIQICDRAFDVLRIRHLDNFSQVKPVQEAFSKHGIKLCHLSCHKTDVEAHIFIKKVFCLCMLTDQIYIDDREANHAYFVIPNNLSFDEFTEVTRRVKNNWPDTKFDAALGMFLREKKVVDFVRVYSKRQDEEYLESIHGLYLKKIKQFPGMKS